MHSSHPTISAVSRSSLSTAHPENTPALRALDALDVAKGYLACGHRRGEGLPQARRVDDPGAGLPVLEEPDGAREDRDPVGVDGLGRYRTRSK